MYRFNLIEDNLQLVTVGMEYAGSILGSDIIPLPVYLGGVVEGEEYTEYGPEVDFLRIEHHLTTSACPVFFPQTCSYEGFETCPPE